MNDRSRAEPRRRGVRVRAYSWAGVAERFGEIFRERMGGAAGVR
jgi:hypothetical protein